MASPVSPLSFPAPSGRVALVGDTHGATKDTQQVLRSVADMGVKVVIQLGDFGWWPGEKDEVFMREVSATCETLGLTLLFMDGNHEDHHYLQAERERSQAAPDEPAMLLPELWHIPRGYRWEWAGRVWCALGGGVSPDRGTRSAGFDWFPEEAVTLAQAERVVEGGPVDVLLLHDYPELGHIPRPGQNGAVPLDSLEAEGIRRTSQDIYGETHIAAAEQHSRMLGVIARQVNPSLVFHGHWHTSYRWSSPCGIQVHGLARDGQDGQTVVVDVETLEVSPVPVLPPAEPVDTHRRSTASNLSAHS